jgi:hypothetical protein
VAGVTKHAAQRDDELPASVIDLSPAGVRRRKILTALVCVRVLVASVVPTAERMWRGQPVEGGVGPSR